MVHGCTLIDENNMDFIRPRCCNHEGFQNKRVQLRDITTHLSGSEVVTPEFLGSLYQDLREDVTFCNRLTGSSKFKDEEVRIEIIMLCQPILALTPKIS